MRKILIISYYFPPCTLTASNRIYSWAKNLHQFGYYPIIVTRKWEKEIVTLVDMSHSTTTGIDIVKKENFEVHFLPYKGNLKDRLYESGKLSYLRKGLSLFELIINNYFTYFLPYKNLFHYSRKQLKLNDINRVLISGGPFQLFQFGYLLKNEFKQIKWFADYRDDWNTSEIFNKKGFLKRNLQKLESISEKRWLSNAHSVISISDHYSQKIGGFVKKQNYTIYNGFENFILDKSQSMSKPNVINILFNGSLYDSQPVEKFIALLNLVQIKMKDKVQIALSFIGVGIDEQQENRILELASKVEFTILTTKRINKTEVIKKQQEADILLMLAHENLKGIPSSKIFEYLSLKKPFIVFPNDFDILEKIANDSGMGTVVTDEEELIENIEIALRRKNNRFVDKVIDESRLLQFSVVNQVQKLAEVLNGK